MERPADASESLGSLRTLLTRRGIDPTEIASAVRNLVANAVSRS